MSSQPTLLQRGKLRGEGLENEVPIDYIINWFRQRINLRGVENRLLVLKSETASGKSTVLPPALWKANLARGGMVVTQPRVLTAKKNVEEILKHNKFTSREIGYSTKYDKMRPSRTGILSATLGTLTAELASSTDEQIANHYRYIILDEAHERNVDNDITIAALKGLLLRMATRDDCPFVVLASATFEPDVFLRYFGVGEANFIWCGGAPQPIDERWSYMGDHVATDFVKSVADVVGKISREDDEDRSDILVFLPGSTEIRAVTEQLHGLNVGLLRKNAAASFALVAIDGVAVSDETAAYRALDGPMTPVGGVMPRRRVILSTVVAETGLTLDNLKYVIDVGLSRETEFNPVTGVGGLITKPAAQSRIRQRRGRAGRKFPGVFYPLYPKYIYDKLQQTQYPEIITANCGDYLLRIIGDKFESLDLVTNPTSDNICAALRMLHNCGLMRGHELTPMGKIAQSMPQLPPDYVRAILAAYYWGISPLDMIIAMVYARTSMLVSRKTRWNVIYATAGVAMTPAECTRVRLMACDEFIDGIVLYTALERAESIIGFCDQAKIGNKAVSEFAEAVDDMIGAMVLAELRITTNAARLDVRDLHAVSAFKHCIYDGFVSNLLVFNPAIRKYVSRNGTHVRVPAMLADKKSGGVVTPTFVVADRFVLDGGVAAAAHACVLDGFLSPDIHFGY